MQDIDEQESLDLLRKWREEEKRRKEEEQRQQAQANTNNEQITRRPPERKKSLLEIVGRPPPSPPTRLDPDERARVRGEAFLSIRVQNSEGTRPQRQSLLAATRTYELQTRVLQRLARQPDVLTACTT